MFLDRLLEKVSGAETEDEDFLELEFEGTEKPAAEGGPPVAGSRVQITVAPLEEYADSDKVQRKLRDGNIVLVNIEKLKEKDIGELKRAIARIRKTTVAVNGDIAGVADNWIVVCPSIARINRSAAE